MNNNRRKRLITLREAYEKEPYSVKLSGLNLRIEKGVFPPDVSFATLKLGKILGNYRPESAIDIGSGSGYLAFVLKRNGVQRVFASDINPAAINCIKENVRLNPGCNLNGIYLSDLFSNLKENLKFDLIIFNHFYRPEGTGIFGPVNDAGKEIIERFLTQSKQRLTQNGVIIMNFVEMSDPENSPAAIAKQMGYKVKVLFQESNYQNMGNFFVYEFKLPS